ncbi:MAG TPA: DUF3795 domain-containing protein [Clostridia bacterium]|nr:DUF3795 domain-containing protein [Clostridia bacterium]HQM96371.1 DUF3795 domain-containing protein [Clostridia bacterium]HQO69813.1 DUF3795 domain-containing protein [Clostridia bacterium]
MKGFSRKNTEFSLCGLNCALCVMHIDKYCPGCGGGEGNQTCRIARCSMDKNGKNIEYCYLCNQYPCDKYDGIENYDSFITHRKQMKDLEKAKIIGLENYLLILEQKEEVLKYLLNNYNDGRSKNFYCLAVNLMDINDIKEIIMQFERMEDLRNMTLPQQAVILRGMFSKVSSKSGITLKLNKKKVNI